MHVKKLAYVNPEISGTNVPNPKNGGTVMQKVNSQVPTIILERNLKTFFWVIFYETEN